MGGEDCSPKHRVPDIRDRSLPQHAPEQQGESFLARHGHMNEVIILFHWLRSLIPRQRARHSYAIDDNLFMLLTP